ncbi:MULTISPECIES: methionine--tRNA ligase [Kyrpidia]|uniref:Methionine--tRNA ligase n=1 Tax=Kyrpidia spormannii TaxID=2055160 RepID=A0A6F9DZM6_9BACL|nr:MULTISPECIES: methionine--tRNA ligase [Kyrpidia]MCL6576643.1 methionine--tRNA ligase [Kyrpidia sp.]CAB3389718.1 methionyl-tRNA synthetase [Kyrpidia spormannii]
MGRKTFYITTPIYYPSNKLHIGHAYTTVAADAMARYKRLRGYDVMYLTGTDEHGQKIERRAREEGKTPQAFVDEIVGWIQELWRKLDISYDDFIRTTQPRHKKAVQRIFQRLMEQGDIYQADYEGLYCTPCESFWTARQAEGGRCPDCGRPVELVREKSYFFRMSKYVPQLLRYYEENPDFIQPESRKHEMINNFIKPGLEDLCVSRTTFDWGIPVPGDPEHVIYVWIDALSNYITALGYLSDDPAEREKFERYWPADVHVVGKEIVRFHTIYWPIMLMALGLPLPKKVFGHGWLLTPQGKMSKSKGNVIDPNLLLDRYGSDAIRYFLLREIPFGADGVFTPEALIQRLNFDLANDLGNLLNRTLPLIERFAGGRIPTPTMVQDPDGELRSLAAETVTRVEEAMEKMEFSTALAAIWQLLGRANKYIDETAPWAEMKAGRTERAHTVLYHLAEVIRIVSILLQPFLTKAPVEMQRRLGLSPGPHTHWDSARMFGTLPPGLPVYKGDPLFPRLDLEAEVLAIDEATGAVSRAADSEGNASSASGAKQVTGAGSAGGDGAGAAEGIAKAEDVAENHEEPKLIGIEEFQKIDLRVGRIVEAERIPKADKLLKLMIDLGSEVRQVVSGIAQYYRPEELVGQRVVVVTNLKPVKLRGVESRGMILAASEGDRLVLTTVSDDIPLGTKVK